MKLTRSAFELLLFLVDRGEGKYTQKFLADHLSISVGLVNKLISDFKEHGLIEVNKYTSITEKGLQALEPYKVKKAIILAAGFSERLAPITLETPKPLVTVHNVRIIDTLIDALYLADIEDISIVIGHKAEKFNALADKYPNIKLIKNELYNQSGNITSLYSAIKEIDSCYICDADLFLHNPKVIKKYVYSSSFFGVPVRETDDWCYQTNGKEIIDFSLGGDMCYRAVFIAYVSSDDSKTFQHDLHELVHSRGGKEKYWFDVLFGKYKEHYSVQHLPCYPEDVSEIDLLTDLVKLDNSYRGIELT